MDHAAKQILVEEEEKRKGALDILKYGETEYWKKKARDN